MSHFIEVQHAEMVFKSRKGSFHALHDINLTVSKGEFITLIGHSGCGKSTLLNLIAGLTTATEGALICAGREIAGPSPERGVRALGEPGLALGAGEHALDGEVDVLEAGQPRQQ